MINYEDIPIHIRCTNRHLINPDYPGDAAFWRAVSMIEKRDRGTQRGYYRPPPALSETAKTMVNMMTKHGEYSRAAFGNQLGLSEGQINAAVSNMGFFYPVYQTNKNNRTTYGILGITDGR
jgi:hypothetical protein